MLRYEFVVRVENPHHLQSPREVVSGNQEKRGFAGGQESRMALAVPSAEFRVGPAEQFVVQEKRVEGLWAKVGEQREREHQPLIESQLHARNDFSVGRVRVQLGRGAQQYVQRFAFVVLGAKVLLETQVDNLPAPIDFVLESLFHVHL